MNINVDLLFVKLIIIMNIDVDSLFIKLILFIININVGYLLD